jgi:hypothetical protein
MLLCGGGWVCAGAQRDVYLAHTGSMYFFAEMSDAVVGAPCAVIRIAVNNSSAHTTHAVTTCPVMLHPCGQ